MIATIYFESEHSWRVPLGSDPVSRVSYAMSEVLRAAGIPYPGGSILYNTLRFEVDGDILIATYRRRTFQQVEYSVASELPDTIAKLINLSSLDAGIPGVIAETIRFTVEDDE